VSRNIRNNVHRGDENQSVSRFLGFSESFPGNNKPVAKGQNKGFKRGSGPSDRTIKIIKPADPAKLEEYRKTKKKYSYWYRKKNR
jgi:hypothetical protein